MRDETVKKQKILVYCHIETLYYEKRMYLLSVLLLWLPGCFSNREIIKGLTHVEFEENSLGIIKCQYASGWENYVKWWCRGYDWYSCEILVKTTEPMRVSDRVSIQDNATALTFTVKIKNIRKKDEDFYWCGIERTAASDHGFQIKVTVVSVPRRTTTTRNTTTTVTISTGNITGTKNSYSYERPKITDLLVLLPIIFGILLIILVGASILAWRMLLRQRKEAEKLAEQESQPTQEDICYIQLNLHGKTSPLNSPDRKTFLETSTRINSIHQEVEYVTMGSIKREDITYATPFLNTPNQDLIYSNMQSLITHSHPENPTENTEYSL
ncbi:CMRF35-like molecule 1 isoform X2 [Sarcophilus harrisii]|uniref:CMRF35-like molecule 1 isoform X2 n=1 Tax=Sarcophilus harrisii TaxID=9305 RepID=UPI001301C564|nr:CMRF35-like molecule 1 isoform X2 [Sarcophilus harrisii]